MGWGTSRGGLRCFDFLHVKQMTFIIAKSEDVSVTESGNPIAQWQVIEKGPIRGSQIMDHIASLSLVPLYDRVLLLH
jgi:hypothetical protein